MIFASGLVDYALEFGYGGSLPSSIHEYFGGVLFGGFQDPHTRLSAFFQICCALIVLIIVSAYTANLAAFLTLSNSPTLGFGSVHDLISSRTSVCSIGSYASQDTLQTVYPDLNFDVSHTSGGFGAVGGALVHGGCEAAILQKIDFDSMLTDGCNCQLSVVGSSLFFSTAGWVTNVGTSSTLCVQRPIEYALHSLQADGTLDTIFNRYMQPGGCVPSGDPTCSAAASRRLQTDSLGASHVDGQGRAAPAQESRRLASSGGGGGVGATAASSSNGSDEALPQMTFENFWGVFVLWGCVASLVLLMRIGSHYSPPLSHLFLTQDDSKAKEDEKDTYLPDPSTYPKGLDINNQSAMLRFLVVELHHLRERVDHLQGTAKKSQKAETRVHGVETEA